MSTVFPLLNNCMTSSKTVNKATRQERPPPLNPYRVGFKCPLEIRKTTICLQITLSNTLIITYARRIGRYLLGTVLSLDLKTEIIASFLRDESITPESRDSLNRIKGDGGSYEAQFNNREAEIPSGPATQFDDNSFMESIMIDSVIMLLVRDTSSS